MRREIVDESDVYVDVHKAIRRLTPAPRAQAVAAAAAAKKTTEHPVLVDIGQDEHGNILQVAAQSGSGSERPRTAIFMKRRPSTDRHGATDSEPEPMRESLQDLKHQARLGPANRAAKPRTTRQDVFKTKQGLGSNSHQDANGSKLPEEGGPAGTGQDDGNETSPLLRRSVTGPR